MGHWARALAQPQKNALAGPWHARFLGLGRAQAQSIITWFLCPMGLSYVLWPCPMSYGPVLCPMALAILGIQEGSLNPDILI